MKIYFRIVYFPNDTIVIRTGSAHFKGGNGIEISSSLTPTLQKN